MGQKKQTGRPVPMTEKEIGRTPEARKWAKKAYERGEIDIDDGLVKDLGAKLHGTRKMQRPRMPDIQPGEIVWPPAKRLKYIAGLDGKEIGAFSWVRDKSDLVDYDHNGEIRCVNEESILLGYTQESVSKTIDDDQPDESGLETTWARLCYIDGHEYLWKFRLRPRMVVKAFSLDRLTKNSGDGKSVYEYRDMIRSRGYFSALHHNSLVIMPDGTSGLNHLAFANKTEEKVMMMLQRMDEPSAFLLDRWLDRKAHGQNIYYDEICDEYESIFRKAFESLPVGEECSLTLRMKAGSLAEKIVGRSDRGHNRCLLQDAINVMKIPCFVSDYLGSLYGCLGAWLRFEGEREPTPPWENNDPKTPGGLDQIYGALGDWRTMRNGVLGLRNRTCQ